MIELDTLREKKSLNHSLTKLNDYSKALVTGSAGMGKSTFFRHSILNVIDHNNVSYLKHQKNSFPIFIQLKTVANVRKSPILHYIFEEIPFFSKTYGLNKFRKLARDRKLFIVLDGYDEISFSASQNYIQDELSLLLSAPSSLRDMLTRDKGEKITEVDLSFSDIYQSLSNCTVWLSTRAEFLQLNPLRIDERVVYDRHARSSGGQECITLKLIGLGDNRYKLVKKNI
jgi:hypothetical protein